MAVERLCFFPLVRHLQDPDGEIVLLLTSKRDVEREAINLEFSDIFGAKGVILLLIYFSLSSR
jgi:hypothetical protein